MAEQKDAVLAMQRIGLPPLQVIVDEIGRMRRALDAIYAHNEAARAAVIQHYGLRHVDLSECVIAVRKQISARGVKGAANGG